MDLCSKCIDRFYVDNINDRSFCQPKISVTFGLKDLYNPKLFSVSFNEEWRELLDNIGSSLKLTIDSLSNSSYIYEIQKSSYAKLLFIQLSFSERLAANSKMTINITANFTSEQSKYFWLSNSLAYIYMEEYVPCGQMSYWNWGS
jgi:hypothetical protein